MVKQVAPVSTEEEVQVTPIQKVFTVLTRSKHRATDWQEIDGFRVATVEICKKHVRLGIFGDHRLGIFAPSDDDFLLFQILLSGDFKMNFEQEIALIGKPHQVSDMLHVAIDLVDRIEKEINDILTSGDGEKEG